MDGPQKKSSPTTLQYKKKNYFEGVNNFLLQFAADIRSQFS